MAVPASPSRPALSLPQLVDDPIWSIQPWPVAVDFHGRTVEIPAMPAAGWLAALMPRDWGLGDVFPGLLEPDDAEWVDDQIAQGDISEEDLEAVQRNVLSTVTGRPWYVSMRLIQLASGSWDVLGADILMQADATVLSIAGWLDVLYLVILRAMDQNKAQLFVSELGLPPVGYATEDPQDMEMTQDAFLALGA